MLSLEQRPRTFEDLAGQDLVKKALLHIVQDPVNAPKTLLLEGSFGCGKTTTARIFARALNCRHRKPNGDACGVCEFCKSEIQDSMFYDEYDSAIVGNVNSIKELRDTFYFGYSEGYKVIVLDEIHLVSRQAMGALLKVFEEPEPNVFFVLCTTDPQKLLPTILSRSFSLRFNTISHEDIVKRLTKIANDRNIEITDEINNNFNLIAERSHGHMRNAMMLLDSMFLLKEDFKETVSDSTPQFQLLLGLSLSYKQLVLQQCQKDTSKTREQHMQDVQNKINQVISKLTTFPISNLKQDYENFVLKVTKHTFAKTQEEITDTFLADTIKDFKNSFELLNILNSETIYSMFRNEVQFQIAMLVLSNKLIQLKR